MAFLHRKDKYSVSMRDCPSVQINFNKDAVSEVFSDGTDSLAVLIWSFVMIPGAQLRSQPDHCNAVDLPGMPVCNYEDLNCSCVRGTSIFSTTSTDQQDQSKSICLPEDVNMEDKVKVDTVQYTVTIPIKGSTYGEEYQNNLKFERTSIRLKKEVLVELSRETDNPKDKNAIIIKANIDGQLHPLGYVGLQHIPKVAAAMRKKEFVKITVKHVTSWFVKNINERKLRGSLLLCKTGKWLSDAQENMYNSEF
ncbi:unnamed protein product [Mytilus edulis]|uniref:Uncharacterized protein n=1 Tax=Mytilus edulis TaxID=6550 RepID=A0A8S3TEJ4_MYTED|nr:unnamed protein product [Mytilus edulis]